MEQRHDGTWGLYHDSLSAWLRSLLIDDPFFCDEAAGHRALAGRLLRVLDLTRGPGPIIKQEQPPAGSSWEHAAARVLDLALPLKQMLDLSYPVRHLTARFE